MDDPRYFFSYARYDAEFVLKLARELRTAGVSLWLDQLDIVGGQRWDRAVEEALAACGGLIAVLSPESLASNNVMDEVSYALESDKLVIPILLRACNVPFRLRRVQHVNFTQDYESGFTGLLRALRVDRSGSIAPTPVQPDVAATPDRHVQMAAGTHAEVPTVALPIAQSNPAEGAAVVVPPEEASGSIGRSRGIAGLVDLADKVRTARFPSYWKAFVLQVVGLGLFYVDRSLRRKWFYVWLLPYAFFDAVMASLNVSLFRSNEFGGTTFFLTLTIYCVSFVDVMLICRRQRLRVTREAYLDAMQPYGPHSLSVSEHHRPHPHS